jgi:hypothetical protein
MRNGAWSRRRFPFVVPSVVVSNKPDRLISRFFLNLRAIYYYGDATVVSQTAVSGTSPIRTYSFWKQPRRLPAGFSSGFGAETSTYDGPTTRNEGVFLRAESVDMDVGMVLKTRRDEDNNDVKLDVDAIEMDVK